jgi:outer membrane protein assembly factor BamE (lipoprotein component of BamABCDE complex)
MRLKRKYRNGVAQIQVGETKQSVISRLGGPDDRSWCYPLPTDRDTLEMKQFHERCVDEFWYATFLKSYIVTFDRNGRVSSKGAVVSP